MEKRMERSLIYNGTITAEQFLLLRLAMSRRLRDSGISIRDMSLPQAVRTPVHS